MHFKKYCFFIRRIATRERNALLLYNGRFNERHDFIAIEIVEEQIQLTFSAGELFNLIKHTCPYFKNNLVHFCLKHSISLNIRLFSGLISQTLACMCAFKAVPKEAGGQRAMKHTSSVYLFLCFAKPRSSTRAAVWSKDIKCHLLSL